MAVKIRLARRGRKKQPLYDVVVADVRAPRDGRYIEKIGRYNPNTDPATVDLNEEKAFEWVMKGAQPTDTVRAMLSYRGIMLKKHLQIGVNKGAITQEAADKKFDAWLEDKEGKIASKRDLIAKESADTAKARKEAESKVREARAEALRKKNTPVEEAPVVAEEATEDAPTGEGQEPAAMEATTEDKGEPAEVKAEQKEQPAEVKNTQKAEAAEAKEEKKEVATETKAEAKEEKKEVATETKVEAKEEKKEEVAEVKESKKDESPEAKTEATEADAKDKAEDKKEK